MDVSLSKLRELVMDREAWRAVIHGVTKSRTRLSNWTNWLSIKLGFPGGLDGKESACNAGDQGQSLGQENPLEEGMATHTSILA